MLPASTARALVRRLHPWLGKAVHARWHVRRTYYREESEHLLAALAGVRGAYLSVELHVRLEKFFRLLHREWFPDAWQRQPPFADVLKDFRWWLDVAERWNEPKPKPRRVVKRKTPRAEQPEELLRRLGLPADCSAARFMTAWRRFVKQHHPDRNPNQTAEEKRRFAEAVALRRR